MPGENCSVWGCGSCRRTKGLGIFKLPAAKDPKHKKWREGWLGEITKTREKNAEFQRLIDNDAVFTCEKHFKPDKIDNYGQTKPYVNHVLKQRGAGSEAWNRVSLITPVKKFGRTRLSTDSWERNMADFRKRKAFVKCCKRFVCFRFKHLRKSSSCPTSKLWTFRGSGDKYCTVSM